MTLALAEVLESPCLHVAVDMQRIFAEPTDWHTPALWDILPHVEAIVRHAPRRAVLTRFMTPENSSAAHGAWSRFYRHWESVTLEHIRPALLDVVEPLAGFAPPARICDKTTHSAFNSGGLGELVRRQGARALVLTGVETDVCVLSTALDAIDLGYQVVVVVDAVASGVPASHQATIEHTLARFDQQIVMTTTAELLDRWVPG